MVAVCTICGKECANGTGLSSHMKSHRHEQGVQRRHGLRQRIIAPVTSLLPHLCKACGMTFMNARGLHNHATANFGSGCRRRSRKSQPSSMTSQQTHAMDEDIGTGIKMEVVDEQKNGEEEILSEAASGEEQQGEGEGAYSGGNTDEEAEEEEEDGVEGVPAAAQDSEMASTGSSLPPAPLPSNHESSSAFVPNFNKALENSARLANRREPCAFTRLRELQRTHPEVMELAQLTDEVRISNKGTVALF